ncbi:MAG: hypothetical protein ABW166_18610 [Sedimenticola sp.]
MDTLVTSIIFVAVVLSVYGAALVSYHTVRSDFFEKKQKIIIISIAWLVPVLGPAFILTILSQDKPKYSTYVPLLDFLFLSAVFTQSNESDEVSENQTSGVYTNFGDSGGDAGDGGDGGGGDG